MLVHVRTFGHASFMRAPTELSRRNAFLVKTLHAPRVDELADFLRPVRDLRIALGNVDDLHTEVHCQGVVGPFREGLLDRCGHRRRTSPAFTQHALADGGQRILREVRHEPRVRAVLEDCRRARRTPGCHLPTDVHMTDVEAAIARVLRLGVGVGVPELDARVEVAHAMVVAPRKDHGAVDVPCEIEKDVTGRQVRTEEGAEVVRRDPVDHETYASGDLVGDPVAVVHEVHDDDLIGSYHVAQQQREGALCDRTAAEHEDRAAEGHASNGGELHRGSLLVVRARRRLPSRTSGRGRAFRRAGQRSVCGSRSFPQLAGSAVGPVDGPMSVAEGPPTEIRSTKSDSGCRLECR